ncbi:mitochondrial arginine transporter BAC1 isoform X1 [Oryza glaberrima]|uniref:mitochondrial arginine transporter BAC1 isoform X1 n=1 Tax=Oryza glaberrima TaxID=4538 RepID=UPI00224C00B4|nr:mitochondrial arginine transporter BAC1 isoform X1 [Oryza glaberrima]
MTGAGDAAKEYAAGCAAGIAQVAVGHPFDTVKVKLQAHNTTAHGKVYRNAFHCTRRILVEEGMRGLYKGASSSFIGIALESSLFFGTYSQAKQLLKGKSEDGRPQLQVIIPSAACSGALISCILTPTELMKCRMQVQGKHALHGTRYSSPLDCAMKTLQSEGVCGLFRGGLATLFREAVGNAVFFCTYEYSRYWMHRYLDSPWFSGGNHLVLAKDVGVGIMSGGISGMAFWTATLPLDVAKTIIQTDPDPHLSRNPFQILKMSTCLKCHRFIEELEWVAVMLALVRRLHEHSLPMQLQLLLGNTLLRFLV